MFLYRTGHVLGYPAIPEMFQFANGSLTAQSQVSLLANRACPCHAKPSVAAVGRLETLPAVRREAERPWVGDSMGDMMELIRDLLGIWSKIYSDSGDTMDSSGLKKGSGDWKRIQLGSNGSKNNKWRFRSMNVVIHKPETSTMWV